MENNILINGFFLECALGETPAEIREKLFADDPAVLLRKHEALQMPFFAMAQHKEEDHIHDAAWNACRRAVKNALEMAFPGSGLPPRGMRVGCVAGTTGDVQFGDLDFYRALKEEREPEKEKLLKFVHGTTAERIVEEYGFTGPAVTISNSCVSGADAVLLGAQWLEADVCDLVVVWGVDLLSPMCLTGFYTLGAASQERCRPFDSRRSGMNVGEGCGCVILRKEKMAPEFEKHFSKAEFRLCGGGSACDAYHMTAPHPEGRGLQTAMRKALKMANLEADDIAFVNAHGTGTAANDASEACALKVVLGAEVPYFSTKGLTGHTLGASGIIELIFTMLCLKEGKIPGSFGCSEKADDIVMAPNMELRPVSGRIAMSTSLAFGGCNTALIVERMENVLA